MAGNIAINEFSLKKLLENLGQPAIETSDGDVLTALAFSTNIGGAAGKPELTDLTLKLDDTTFNGSGSYNLASSALVFRLTGDELNADRYLPPPSDPQRPKTALALILVLALVLTQVLRQPKQTRTRNCCLWTPCVRCY